MSLTATIVLIVTFDVALLALLAFVMTRPASLRPHRAATRATQHDWRLVRFQRSPLPRRQSTTYQTATRIKTPSGRASERIEPLRK